MLDCASFYGFLKNAGVDFCTGVPDSLLKDFCAFLGDHALPSEHIIAANEGGAVGLAIGHYLATGRAALVYMQNSGQGNAVNPLLSICDPEVYGIPMLLLVGWRGEPSTKDEPQHVKQGRVTRAIFEAMELPFEILSDQPEIVERQVTGLINRSLEESRPVALMVKRETFADYSARKAVGSKYALSREASIEALLDMLPLDAIVVSTTGHISRELYTCREKRGDGHGRDFLMVGGMGHTSQVALGIAMSQSKRPVFCFDGDGSTLMHMGGMALAGQSECRNFKHIVFNNGAHGSVGGQPTLGFSVNLSQVALACGYKHAESVTDAQMLKACGKGLLNKEGPTFVEVRVSLPFRDDLARPSTTPEENKTSLMRFIHAS
jgi:phosphonopyruvate decarboxylase